MRLMKICCTPGSGFVIGRRCLYQIACILFLIEAKLSITATLADGDLAIIGVG